MTRLKSLVGALALLAVAAGPAQAQGAPAAAVEPQALAVLRAMGARLAEARTLSFTATAVHEQVNAEGQAIFYIERSRVDLKRPGHLRVFTIGDGPASVFLVNPDSLMLLRLGENTASTRVPPGDLAASLKLEAQAIGRTPAFADVLLPDPGKSFTEGLTRAFLVGRSRIVGGVETDIVAIASADAQAQIWIGTKDRLPRQLVVTHTGEPGRPRNTVAFSNWSVDRPIADRVFTSSLPRGATLVPFAAPAP